MTNVKCDKSKEKIIIYPENSITAATTRTKFRGTHWAINLETHAH